MPILKWLCASLIVLSVIGFLVGCIALSMADHSPANGIKNPSGFEVEKEKPELVHPAFAILGISAGAFVVSVGAFAGLRLKAKRAELRAHSSTGG